MNKATLIRTNLPNFRGDAQLWHLDPPITGYKWQYQTDTEIETTFEYVVVSAAIVEYSGPETYIFGADKDGNVLDWAELPGSERGHLSHERAINNADYVIEMGTG